MRPLRLTALGLLPDDGEMAVDFRPASDAGVFLLVDQAGVGARVLADAICLALHGELPGGEAGAHRREPSPRPFEVVLDFAVADVAYRVIRRAVAGRSVGARRQEPEAVLLRQTGVGASLDETAELVRGWHDVTSEVERLVGYGAGAFRTILAPPQRDLRDLILGTSSRTRSSDGTHVHARIAKELSVPARYLGERIEDLVRSRQLVLQAATEELEPQRADPLSPDDLVSRRDVVATQLGRVAGSVARLADADVIAQRLLEENMRRAGVMRDYGQAEAVLRKLDDRRIVIESVRARLDRARRAESLRDLDDAAPLLDALRDAERAAQAAESAASLARQRARRAAAALTEQEAKAGDRDETRARAKWLAHVRDAVAAREPLRAAARSAESRERERGAALAALEAQLGDVTQRLAEAEDIRRGAARGRPHVDALRTAAQAAAERRDLVVRLAGLRQRLRTEARDVQLVRLKIDRVAESIEQARREMEYRASADGARATGEPGGGIAALLCQRELLLREEAQRAEQLQATRGELRDTTEQLGPLAWQEVELVEAQARQAAEALGRAQGAFEHRAQVDADVGHLGREGVRLTRALETARIELQDATRARDAALAALADRERDVPAELRAPGAVEEAIARERETLARLERQREAAAAASAEAARAADERDREIQGARRVMAAARRAVEEQQAQPLRRLAEAGFASREEAEAARVPPDELERLAAEVAEHAKLQDDMNRRERLGRDLASLPAPDLEQLQLMVELTRDSLAEARVGESLLSEQLARFDAWLDRLDEAASALSALDESVGLSRRMEALAGSHDAPDSVEGCVEWALMDEVLDRASLWLARAVDAPPALMWQRDADPGAAPRHRLELAGGGGTQRWSLEDLTPEQGMAVSAALALATAEVVRAHGGRGEVETMLWEDDLADLDDVTVETVLRMLEALSVRGVRVGLVGPLRRFGDRIPTRLDLLVSHARERVHRA